MLKLSELICNQIVVCLIHIENVCYFLKENFITSRTMSVKNWVDWGFYFTYILL